MKLNNFTPLFTLILSLVTAVLLTACAGHATRAEPVQPDPSAKLAFAPSAKSPLGKSSLVSNSTLQLFVDKTKTPVDFKAFHYQAGTLLQDSDNNIFYLTEAGTRRRIHDPATFAAFGFKRSSIVKVDDSLLKILPLAEELTPLVWGGNSNLYWIFKGQRWLVNEWKPVVTRPDYNGVPATRLDNHLEQTLPVRLGFESGMLLHDDQVVYYFNGASIIPTPAQATAAAVVDVPAGVLAAYQVDLHLIDAYLNLNDGGTAEVRQGPGVEYSLLGTIARKIMTIGRSEDGQWLLVNYQDQPGWLAADQIADPVAVSLLPPVPATLETGLPEAQSVALNTANIP